MQRPWSQIAPVFFAALAFACTTAELKPAPGQGSSPTDPESPSAGSDGENAAPGGGTGGTGGTNAAPQVVTSDVTIQVQPSDSGSALLAAIKGAKKSVHMTMYLLTNNQAVSALVALKKAGKDVKVILNKTFPPNGGSNQDAYDELTAKGVPVVWAPAAYEFTHAKTIVIDGEKLIAMTMNLTQTSAQTNREYIATDTDPQDVKDAEAIFDADYNNKQSFVPNTKLVVSPQGSTQVDARARLESFIDSATKSLDVEAQSLSDDKLVDAIVRAHQSKVDVHVVLDANTINTSGQQEAIAKLKASGVPVRAVATPDIHAKAMVVDETRAFVGSMNLTPTALVANREVGVITDAQAEAAKVRTAISGDFAKGTTP